jgi:hypothetical protein
MACTTKKMDYARVTTTEIRQEPTYDMNSCYKGAFCPQIPVYDAKGTFAPYSWDDINDRLGVWGNGEENYTTSAFDAGIGICSGCEGPNVASRLITSYLLETSLEEALPLIYLHLRALKYRNDLQTVDGSFPSTYNLEQPAVLITNSAYVYACSRLSMLLVLFAILARAKMLSAVGEHRKESLRASAAVLQNGPFSQILERGSMKSQGTFLREADELLTSKRKLENVDGMVGFDPQAGKIQRSRDYF